MTKQEEILIIRTPEQAEAHKAYLATLKREEIREGIARAICCLSEDSAECKWCEDNGGCPGWGDVKEDVERVIHFLHSQGVVIKVDGELPKLIDRYRGQVKRVLIQSGYTAFEPLI